MFTNSIFTGHARARQQTWVPLPAQGQDAGGEAGPRWPAAHSSLQPAEYNLQIKITTQPPCLVCILPQISKIPPHPWRNPLGSAINHHWEGEGTAHARGEHLLRGSVSRVQWDTMPEAQTQDPIFLSQNAPYDTHKHAKSCFSSQLDQKQGKFFGTTKEKPRKALSYDSNHRQEAFQPSRD